MKKNVPPTFLILSILFSVALAQTLNYQTIKRYTDSGHAGDVKHCEFQEGDSNKVMSISNNKIESFQISFNAVTRVFQTIPTDQVSYLTTFKTASWYAVTTTLTKKILIFEWNVATPLKTFTTSEELFGIETLGDDSKIVTVIKGALA